jgi:hypothetical protein
VEPRLHGYCAADHASKSWPRRPEPAFANPLSCPVSRDTSNPTMRAQPSPRACTHVASAPKWTYCRWTAHHPDLPAGAQGCGRHSLICDTPDRVRPLLRIAATAVGHLPRLVAAGPDALPSAHGLCVSVAVRQPIPTLPGACAWRVAWVPCAAYIPPGMHHPGARSTHRPQAVVIPRLRHLGWPRMRGVAQVRSHYARVAVGPAGRADQPGLPDPVWRSRRWPMGRRAAAVPGSWEHFKLALICT